MDPKSDHVNKIIPEFGTVGGRIVAERQRLNISQTDLRLRTGVGKTTQINYESGKSSPDAEYLIELDAIGFDVLYILTGSRSTEALTDTEQNLLEIYAEAPDSLKRAAFAVLLTPLLQSIDLSMKVPGYARHELMGEEDVRYQAHWASKHLDVETGGTD